MKAGRALLLAAILLGIAAPLVFVLHAHSANGRSGFPLDDSWIHLTYARNLHDQHSFAYSPGDRTTQGSTAPLYTLLLALGYNFTRDEKGLSYALGLLAHALFLAALALWARRRLGSDLWAAAAVALVALDGRIGLLAVSGMETSLFLLLLALAFHGAAERRPLQTGIALGLAVWTRPDALILAALAGAMTLLERSSGRGLIAAGALIAGYFAFNLALGGAILPETFAAKRAYYAANPRALFLRGDLRRAFLSGAWIVLTPFALLGARRLRLEAAWAVGLPLAYFVMLPYAHRFERYLLPALPAIAVLGVAGIRLAAARAGRYAAIAAGVLLAGALGLQVASAAKGDTLYRDLCRYHWERHERTGLWLAGNTPPGAVVATHDVGAIGYYSKRRIVDMVGIVSPEVVPHVNRPDYLEYLNGLFERRGVTHVAVLRNWTEVVNVAPLFVADPRPEIMEVFPWIAGRTHMMPRAASVFDDRATDALRRRDPAAAIDYLDRSLALDPSSSRTWLLAGAARENSARYAEAEEAYRRALALFPGMADARFRLAVALMREGKRPEALDTLLALRREQPDYPGAAELEQELRR